MVEPSLIVGRIAGSRRLLVVTAQLAEPKARSVDPQNEISILLALVLRMRRFYVRRTAAEE